MSPRQCGLFFVTIIDEPQQRAPLQSIDVSATSCGPIAHNTIIFKYKNNNNTAIQSKFIFPVNSQSSIYHLSAIVGGRTIIGKVQEKKAAQEKYDEAVASGKSAVLAKESKEASDIIELELGAFGADEEAEVIIKEVFEMKLQKNGSQFQYKFPTSLFVRYGDSITATASQNAPTNYVLNFELRSHRGVNKIKPKPWLGSEISGDTFSFQGNRKVFEKDHDVVLDLTLETDFKGVQMTESWQDLTIVNPEERKTDMSIILSSFLVHIPSTPISELPAKEYVFVVDCSGSMDGERIVSAGKTLQLLINSLPVGSFFNIVRFGSSYESLFSKTKEYNKENKTIAIKLAETLAADLGGTELYNCLKSVVESKRQIVDYKRQVFVLTDGDIGDQETTFKLVKKYAKENRFFSFGIGSGCSTALVNGLADAGLGSASFIDDKGRFEWEKQENLSSICVKSLMASASQHISKVDISPLPKSPKERISMVVDSTCLNVFHEGCPTDITLQITLANNQEEYTVTTQDMSDIETMESPFEPNVLHKLAAKRLIGEMVKANLSQYSYGGGSKQEIIDLSVKEQVLSPYTALVGVADESSVVGVSQRVDVGNQYNYGEEDIMVDCYMSVACAMPDEYMIESCYEDCAMDELSMESCEEEVSLDFAALRDEDSPPMMMKRSTNLRSASALRNASPPREMAMASADKKKKKGSLIQSLVSSASKSMSKIIQKPSKKMAVYNDSSDEDTIVASSGYSDVEHIASSKANISPMLSKEYVSTVPSESPVLSKEFVSEDQQISPKSVLTYQFITNQQNPGGEWTEKFQSKHDDTLFKHIEAISEDEVVQFTFYAILLLLVEFCDTFDEWKLSAIKGITFLKKSIPNLNDEISKLLDLLNVQIDEDILEELLI